MFIEMGIELHARLDYWRIQTYQRTTPNEITHVPVDIAYLFDTLNIIYNKVFFNPFDLTVKPPFMHMVLTLES